MAGEVMNLIKPDLEIFAVYDAGVANKERISLRANRRVDLREYAIVLGFKALGDSIYPVPDFFLWLGASVIDGPGWISVFTGSGQPTFSVEVHTKEPMQILYWNRPNVLFGDPNVVPALVRFADVQVFRSNQSFEALIHQRGNSDEIDRFLADLFTDDSNKRSGK